MKSVAGFKFSVRYLALAGAFAFVGASCGGDEAAIAVDEAWARTSPMMSSAGAAYFDISSETDDVLIGVSVDTSVAAVAEIHETSVMHSDDAMEDEAMVEMEEMEDGAMDDVMTMRQVDSVELTANETVSFEPGGLHIMLIDLVAPLEAGDTFDLTLDFETADDEVVTVTVGDGPPQ